MRISVLEAKINEEDEEVKDAQIVARVHELSDSDLDSKMSDFFKSGNSNNGG